MVFSWFKWAKCLNDGGEPITLEEENFINQIAVVKIDYKI